MKRNVVLAVTARLAASLFALLLIATAPAFAGDRALLNMLGYSDDGRYFAYEEFGEHDGAGGVYSSITIVDLKTDKWMYGSPFTVDEGGDTDETPPLSEVRAKALAKAQDKLKEVGIEVPVEILYLLGEGMANERGLSVTFSTPNCCSPGSPQDDAFTLTITPVGAKTEANCAGQEQDVVGFQLNLTDADGKHLLHDDGDRVPKSRGCPLDYRLYAVVAPFNQFGPRLAIVSVYPIGFEGPDRRFMVVPIDAP